MEFDKATAQGLSQKWETAPFVGSFYEKADIENGSPFMKKRQYGMLLQHISAGVYMDIPQKMMLILV